MLNNINFVSDFYSLKQFPCKSKNYPLVCSNNFFDSYRHNVYRHTRLTMRIFSSRLWLSRGRPYIKCKKGGVFIYFKNSLPSKVLDIQLLQECINFELKLLTKFVVLSLCIDLPVNPKMNLIPLQIISSLISAQSYTETLTWLLFLVALIHKLKDGTLGTIIDGITSQFGLEQLIHEPTRIIGERSCCIDLVLASQQNLVAESGVQSS